MTATISGKHQKVYGTGTKQKFEYWRVPVELTLNVTVIDGKQQSRVFDHAVPRFKFAGVVKFRCKRYINIRYTA